MNDNNAPIIFDMSNGVTESGCNDLIGLLTQRSIEALQSDLARQGRPPATPEQIKKVFGI